MKRQLVIDAIKSERDYQDRKWGTVEERPHEVGSWLLLMDVHLQRAKTSVAESNSDIAALEALRKVLAIGLACAEQHGITPRSPWPPVSVRTRDDGHDPRDNDEL